MLAAALALVLAEPDLHVRPPTELRLLHLDVEQMTRERSTQGAIIGTAAVLLAWEVVLMYQRAKGATRPPTISQVMQEWGSKYGMVEWVGGNLAGHWFLPEDRVLSPRESRARGMLLLELTAGVLLWDIVDHSGHDRARPVLLLVGGVISGHTLWGQAPR
jgi:hypothetical protein